MNAEQYTRIAIAFARETARTSTGRLCAACVDVVHATGSGITITGGDQPGQMSASDASIAALEDLQFTIGEGPCRDALRTGLAIHAPRFDAQSFTRWPAFVVRALESDIGAVFAYPLLASGATVGVLSLYQQFEGELTAEQHGDSIALAEVITESVLSLQGAAPPCAQVRGPDVVVGYRAEIHQASGVTAIQLAIPPVEALLRIRSHAFANDRTVTETAAAIVSGSLRLPDDHQTELEI